LKDSDSGNWYECICFKGPGSDSSSYHVNYKVVEKRLLSGGIHTDVEPARMKSGLVSLKFEHLTCLYIFLLFSCLLLCLLTACQIKQYNCSIYCHINIWQLLVKGHIQMTFLLTNQISAYQIQKVESSFLFVFILYIV